jgi:hypothetical protein
MPPWQIDRRVASAVVKNDMSLTDSQIAAIVRWADTGAVKGDPADMPLAGQVPAAAGMGRRHSGHGHSDRQRKHRLRRGLRPVAVATLHRLSIIERKESGFGIREPDAAPNTPPVVSVRPTQHPVGLGETATLTVSATDHGSTQNRRTRKLPAWS